MSDFTPEQVERAAEVLWRIAHRGHAPSSNWGEVNESAKAMYREQALKVLSAAGAPEKVAPVVDEAALAEFLESPTHAPMETHSRADGTCSECPWPVHQLPPAELAAAVAAYLRGESK